MNDAIISAWSAKAAETKIAVWPDGCRDIIAVAEPDQPTKVICTGLDSAVRQVTCKVNTLFFGVRVAPGVSFPWDGDDPLSKNCDVTVSELAKLFKCRVRGIHESPKTALDLLEKTVQRWAVPAPHWIAEYLGSLWSGEENPDPADRFSERGFRRHVVRLTGAPPRYWHGLARARHAARELALHNDRLVDIAAECDFCDQAHMTREIMRWFDCTPMMLRKNREQAAAKLSAPDAFKAIKLA